MRMLHVARNLLFGLVASVSAAGCVTNAGDVLFILQNQVPGEDCTVSPSAGDQFRPEGLIDTGASAGYFFTPVIESRATVPAGQEPSRRNVALQGADITLQLFDENGDPQSFSQAPTEFSTRFSATVEPGGTTGVGFEILKLSHLSELEGLVGDGRWQVLAQVTVFGQLSGGDVESEPFVYPINVCSGCLEVDLGDCASLPSGFVSDQLGGICNDLQDAVLECCDDNGTKVCPAVSTMAAN